MKVLWLHSHFLYPTGGTRFIYEVISRLKKNYDISICVEATDKIWLDKFNAIKIPLYLVSRETSVSPLYWLLLPYHLRREKAIVKKFIDKSDIVITSMFPMNYLASFFTKPVIYFCFEPFAFFYDKQLQKSLPIGKRLGSKLLKSMYQYWDKKGVSCAEKIITINHSVEKWIEKIYDRKADKFSYLGVDTTHFRRRNIPKPSKWQGKQIIFHSTDFTAMKGTHFLIKALFYIVKEVPDVKLIISNTVSDEKVMKNYKNLISDYKLENHVEFIGTLSYEDLPMYYSIADVVCFSADPESIGTTASLFVIEAMSCEAPVVRSIGCNEEVIHSQSGFLADPRNSREYAKFTVKLLKQNSLRLRLGSNARKRIIEYYQWGNVSEVFRKTLQQINV